MEKMKKTEDQYTLHSHPTNFFPHLNLSKPQALPSILGDDRFKVMFENPDYQVDEQSEEFRLLNPIVSKVGQKRKKKLHLLAQQASTSEQVRLCLAISYYYYISPTDMETYDLEAF